MLIAYATHLNVDSGYCLNPAKQPIFAKGTCILSRKFCYVPFSTDFLVVFLKCRSTYVDVMEMGVATGYKVEFCVFVLTVLNGITLVLGGQVRDFEDACFICFVHYRFVSHITYVFRVSFRT